MFLPIVYLAPVLVCLTGVVYISHVYGEKDCNELNSIDVNGEIDEVELSKSRLPFRINLSSNVYGNQETIKVNIGDTLNSSFSVQVRSVETNQRVGRFERFPQSVLQPLFCEGSDQSTIATTRPLNSSNVTLLWQPPQSDKGTLVLTGTFINGNEHWVMKKDGPKIFYHLSRTKKEIPLSLVCYGADVHCREEVCGYEVIYELVNSSTLKIQIEAVNIKHYVYLAMAITSNVEQKLDDSVVMACTLTSMMGIKVTTMPNKSIINYMVDVEGNSFTCTYFVSLEELKRKFGASLHYAHFWGETNHNNGKPILPQAKRIEGLFQPLLDEDTINISCYSPLNKANVLSIDQFNKFLVICVAFIIICLSRYC